MNQNIVLAAIISGALCFTIGFGSGALLTRANRKEADAILKEAMDIKTQSDDDVQRLEGVNARLTQANQRLKTTIAQIKTASKQEKEKPSTNYTTTRRKNDTSSENSYKVFNMGEQISVGYMTYVIDTAEWADKISRSYGDIKPDSSFLIINLRTRNDDNETRQIPPFYLVDENGKKYETTSDSVYLDCNFDFLHKLNPEVSTKGCIVFDVPSNHNYWLKVSGKYWSSTEYALVEIKTTN